ncbi:MAG: hypothetical protein IPP48_04950 [Chitinophagaceae bacterium]|nr:hypothetical protein [Chitinophagaceae bacterium]
MKVHKHIIFCFLLILISCTSFSQLSFKKNIDIHIDTSFFPSIDSIYHLHINNVSIKGNKKTKDYVILREAQVKPGDSINTVNLYNIIEQARQNIYNTTLFTEVKINTIAIDAFNMNIEIIVKEKWYIFPTPQFKLVDRNYKEWSKVYHRDLQRVIYGVKFAHYNLSGRRDQLRVYFVNGYSRGVAISYTAPYSNNKLTEGFSVGINFAQGREINYGTSYSNKLLFFSEKPINANINSLISKGFSFSASYRKRKGIFNTHIFNASYSYLNVTDSIKIKYNPNYFGNTSSSISFPDFSYTYAHNKVDNIAYPLIGKSMFLTLNKRGLGFTGKANMFAVQAGYNKFIDLGKEWYLISSSMASVKLPFTQPYINQRGLGFGGAVLRGLELYAIDGVAFAISKTTLKKKIAAFNLRLPFAIPFFLKGKEKIPFSFYAKTYTDLGYSYNKTNDSFLNRRFLYTAGIGLDVLTFYDFVIRVEYSINQLNEKGLFLRVQTGL